MCGISCVLALERPYACSTKRNKADISRRLSASLEQIRHRGPDAKGIWVSSDCRVALGHVRLEINDLSPSGFQPLHSNDGTVHSVVNGEIYEYQRLRTEMEQKSGYVFHGTSDSELVLALYKYYGISFLSHIRGEFAICLWDQERELFLAVRDRYGIKPLFWTILPDGQLLIAAEVKAFLSMGWTPEWDIRNIIGGDFQIGNTTIFQGVKKVQPGHLLVCRGYGAVREMQYWDSQFPDKNVKDPRSEEEMVTGVRERLLDSIKERLKADVKVGVSLSGGIDSSVVAGMVNHLIRQGTQVGSESANERLSCFGIAFDEDSGFDESAIAQRTAEFLGVKFYRKHMNEQKLAEMFEDATWHDEQVNPDLNYIGVYALSELFQEQGYKVNVNGQGSDEIFGGYNIFLPDFLREPDTAFSGPTVSEKDRIDALVPAEKKLNEIYGGKLDLIGTSVARRQLNNTLTPSQMTAAFPILPFKRSLIASLFPLSTSSVPNTTNPLDPVTQSYTESIPPSTLDKIAQSWHPLHTAHYLFTKAHLQNLLLSHLGDRGEMAHSIEGRVPFLDHHLTEYVNGLPPSMKIRRDDTTGEWIEKYALREAGREFITDEVYTRRKHPYTAPVRFPRDGPLYRVIKRLVTQENVDKLGFLEADGVEELVESVFVDDSVSGESGTGVGVGRMKFRLVFCLAQWVVLQKRFGVMRAEVQMKNGAQTADREGENIMLG